MKLFHIKTMPNGSMASSHTLDRITFADDAATATITSYTDSDVLCWRDDIAVDLSAISGDPVRSVTAWLIAPGGYLAGGTVAVAQTPVELLRAKLNKRVDFYRDQMISGGCDTPAGRVQTDDASIRNILGSVQTAALAKMLDQPFSVEWKMADNSTVALDADGMIGMGVAVMAHIKACYTRSWEIKDAINDPNTPADWLDQYNLTGTYVHTGSGA